MSGGAVVTCEADDVGQTLALAGVPLAHAVVTLHTLAALGPQEVTDTFPAVASGSVSKVSTPADAAVGAFGVVQALPTLPGPSVTRTHI